MGLVPEGTPPVGFLPYGVPLYTENRYSRPCILLKAVKGIVVHWVANPMSSAMANRNYFEGLKDQAPPNDSRFASAHYIIGLEGEILRCVPDNEICYHVGADRYPGEVMRRLSSYPNNCTIGIELCHSGQDGKFNEQTLNSCAGLVSSLLATYRLTNVDVWRHYDITGKICPKYFVEHKDEWDAFKASV
jgi:N-acetylmuramoyl-L-alanine amidase